MFILYEKNHYWYEHNNNFNLYSAFQSTQGRLTKDMEWEGGIKEEARGRGS